MASGADPEPLTMDNLTEVADFSLKADPIIDGDVVFYPRPETLSERPPNRVSLKQCGRHNILSSGPLVLVQRGIYGDCGVGGVVWDASVVLARLIEKDRLPAISSIAGKRVVELGAGCAAVGLAAAVHGAHSVVLTDEKSTLPSTQANADFNKEATGDCQVSVQEADWRCAGDARCISTRNALAHVWAQQLVKRQLSVHRERSTTLSPQRTQHNSQPAAHALRDACCEGMVAAAAEGCDVVMLADCVYDGPAGDTGASVIGALREALVLAKVPLAIIAYKRQRAGMLELAARFLESLKAEFRVEEMENDALLLIDCHEAGIQVITVRLAA